MVTPLMGLLYPDVNSTPGPLWATLLNNAGLLIDGHDHTSGKGKKVPLSTGVNINADIDLTSTWNMINTRSLRFVNNATILSLATDVGCIYECGGDLWYNNAAGIPVHITSGSGLAFASLGTIGGDYGPGDPAEVSYSAVTSLYTFTQDPGVAAGINCGDIYIYDTVLGGKYVHLKVKSGLVADYDLEMPDGLPISDGLLTVSNTGKIKTILQTTVTQSLFETGDYKHTSKATLSAGWIWASGREIGNVGSGATERANADTFDLFKEYFDNYTDVELPIFNSSGVLSTRISYIDAADAFGGTNLCRMHIPDARGRTLVGRDDMNNTAANRITAIGCGIDGTVLGATGGDQRTATHGHANTISASSGTESAQHTHNTGIEAYNSSDFTPSGRIQGCKSPGTYQYTDFFSSGVESATHTHPITIAGGVTNFSGGISANIQPAFICNIMIKL